MTWTLKAYQLAALAAVLQAVAAVPPANNKALSPRGRISITIDTKEGHIDKKDWQGCEIHECKATCRGKGIEHAGCEEDGKCHCYPNEEPPAPKPCNEIECDNDCMSKGHPDGTCDVNGKCLCLDSATTLHHRYPLTANALCDMADCIQHCGMHKNKDGRCDGVGNCLCEGSPLAKDNENKQKPDAKKNDHPKPADYLCDNTDCIEFCRETGSIDGACDAVGTCICKKPESPMETKRGRFSTKMSRRECNVRCSNHCHEHHNVSGKCTNSRWFSCHCKGDPKTSVAEAEVRLPCSFY